MYTSLSVIGSISFIYCMKLLRITTETPAMNSVLCPSPLHNQVYRFLVSPVFWLALVSVAVSILHITFFIRCSTPSLTPSLMMPLIFKKAPSLYFVPSMIVILSLSFRGSRALANVLWSSGWFCFAVPLVVFLFCFADFLPLPASG